MQGEVSLASLCFNGLRYTDPHSNVFLDFSVYRQIPFCLLIGKTIKENHVVIIIKKIQVRSTRLDRERYNGNAAHSRT